ncbi:MAG: hypothetical protein KAS71_09855 [Bacteroidales bacterium]|nr:hypothetical protein [Bacteroidales bacterium]
MITFLKHGEIDRKKWDHCVMNSKQALVYSLSWYLDLVASGWAGLVEDDYLSVMAIPVKKKWGHKYIYQPLFTQQLGIYSRANLSPAKTSEFLKAVPEEIRYIDYNLNHLHETENLEFDFTKRVNYELRLNTSYSHLKNSYSANTKRNLQKTIANIEISESIKIQDIISLKRDNSIRKRKVQYYEWLNCFMDKILTIKKGFLVGAFYRGEIVGAAFFIFLSGRLYYLIPVSSEVGKSERAMFAILDHVIDKYADTGLILDFEGSGIPGIARFFAGFGAKPINYFNFKLNRLAFPFKLFKR